MDWDGDENGSGTHIPTESCSRLRLPLDIQVDCAMARAGAKSRRNNRSWFEFAAEEFQQIELLGKVVQRKTASSYKSRWLRRSCKLIMPIEKEDQNGEYGARNYLRFLISFALQSLLSILGFFRPGPAWKQSCRRFTNTYTVYTTGAVKTIIQELKFSIIVHLSLRMSYLVVFRVWYLTLIRPIQSPHPLLFLF